MNKNILKIIIQRKDLFVPLIFTKKQFDILKKYNANTKLLNAEKKSLYTSIKKKMEALNLFSREEKKGEYFINNPNKILPNRLIEAKKLISIYSKDYEKVFISGSFLFSRTYHDIDIFIIRKRGYKEEWDGNKHIIFITENKLTDSVFQSTSLISVSNFIIPQKIKRKKPQLSELMTLYHEAVIEHIQKETKLESIRRLIFDYNLFCHNRLLNPKELKNKTSKIRLDEIDIIIKELCKTLFSKTYLYVEVHTYIKTLKESIKNIKPNMHLIRFKDTYEELIYGQQRSKTEAA